MEILTDTQLSDLKIKVIEALRTHNSKKELAEKIGMSESSFYYYMQGKKSPSYLSTITIANALGISTSV